MPNVYRLPGTRPRVSSVGPSVPGPSPPPSPPIAIPPQFRNGPSSGSPVYASERTIIDPQGRVITSRKRATGFDRLFPLFLLGKKKKKKKKKQPSSSASAISPIDASIAAVAQALTGGGTGTNAGDAFLPGATPAGVNPSTGTADAASGIDTHTLILIGGGIVAVVLLFKFLK